MRYVQAGFVGEGSTDHEFLSPLIHRVLYEVLFDLSSEEYELPELVSVYPEGRSVGNRPAGIVGEVANKFDYLDIVFYHSDAGGNTAAAYAERVEPVVDGLRAAGVGVVGVVPRREMEAWIIADVEALCDVLGLDSSKIDIPPEFSPSRVERCRDPKLALKEFLESVNVRRFRPVGDSFSFYSSLALSVRVSALRQVPQFEAMVHDIREVLVERGLV